jgi:hypothetical protein
VRGTTSERAQAFVCPGAAWRGGGWGWGVGDRKAG